MKKAIIKISMIAAMTAAFSMSAIVADTEAVTETFTESCSVYNFADDYVEKVAVDGNPVMNVVGPWQDQTSQRAVMSIACEGENGAVAVIDWANDAYTLTRWILHGTMDDKGVISYKNGIKMKIVSGADDEETSTEDGASGVIESTTEDFSEVEGTIEEYNDGEGTIIQNEDGTLTWNDKKENAGKGCVFTFTTPDPSAVGIEDEQLSGGWMRAESSEITQEIKTVLDKAKENFEGSEIEPIAYLGSQIVAGTNYAILAKVTACVPDAKPAYSIVYLYEDLDENAEITGFTDVSESVDVKDMDAVWKLVAATDYIESENETEITGGVEIDYGKSELYSEEDMNQAIDLIEREFAGWEGCELHSISYSSDNENNASNLKWMNELESANDDAETFAQVIMFTSNFHSPKEESGAWNPDEEYTDWQWWLARSDGGEWKLMTWGY